MSHPPLPLSPLALRPQPHHELHALSAVSKLPRLVAPLAPGNLSPNTYGSKSLQKLLSRLPKQGPALGRSNPLNRLKTGLGKSDHPEEPTLLQLCQLRPTLLLPLLSCRSPSQPLLHLHWPPSCNCCRYS